MNYFCNRSCWTFAFSSASFASIFSEFPNFAVLPKSVECRLEHISDLLGAVSGAGSCSGFVVFLLAIGGSDYWQNSALFVTYS